MGRTVRLTFIHGVLNPSGEKGKKTFDWKLMRAINMQLTVRQMTWGEFRARRNGRVVQAV